MNKELNSVNNINTIGEVYRKVFISADRAWSPNHTEKERQRLAFSATFGELEAIIGATTSITTAVAKTFEVFGIEGDMEVYLQHVLHEADSPSLSLRTEGVVDEEGFPQLVLEVLSAIHDQWVVDNEHKFFDPARSEKNFMFAPLPAIGWKTVEADLIFLQPILDDLFGVNPDDEDNFRNAYQQAVADFQAELFNSPAELGRTYPWGMPSAERWSEAIMHGLKDGTYYPILPQSISQALIGDNTPEGWATAQDLRLRYSAQIILHTQKDNA